MRTSVLMLILALSAAIALGQVTLLTLHRVYQKRRATVGARLRDTYTDALVLLLADDADAEARADFIGQLPANTAQREIVATLLLETMPKVRGAAREGLRALFTEAGFVPLHLQHMRQRQAWRRAAAAEALGVMRVEEAYGAVIGLLSDRVPEVRLVAARALGKLGTPEAVEPLLAASMEGLLPPGLAAAAVLRIGPVAMKPLRRYVLSTAPLAASSGVDERTLETLALALRLMGTLGSHRDATTLLPLLASPSATVRAQTAVALGKLNDERAADALRAALTDTTAEVRAAAATALGELGAHEMLPALHAAMADSTEAVRVAATEAHLQLGEPGIEALLAALEDERPLVRSYAVDTLQRSGYADELTQTWRQRHDLHAARALLALARAGGAATLLNADLTQAELEAALQATPLPATYSAQQDAVLVVSTVLAQARGTATHQDVVLSVSAVPTNGKFEKAAREDVPHRAETKRAIPRRRRSDGAAPLLVRTDPEPPPIVPDALVSDAPPLSDRIAEA